MVDNDIKKGSHNQVGSTYDLIIMDHVFPHPLSGFSYQEFTSILERLDNAAVYTDGAYVPLLSKDPINNLITEYKRKHPDLSNRIFYLNNHSCFKAKLLYGIFLNTAYHDLLYWSNKYNIPFVFTLYPGGGFWLDNHQSDEMLKAVFSSPWFRKVIVTQQVTYEYLIDKKFCKKEDIEYIFGGVTDSKRSKAMTGRQHFGRDKSTLDVCFVAHKYTEKGEDKGYDVFIEAAKKLSKKRQDILFHIVGPWDENVIDVSEIKNIIFYGSQSPDWFSTFIL